MSSASEAYRRVLHVAALSPLPVGGEDRACAIRMRGNCINLGCRAPYSERARSMSIPTPSGGESGCLIGTCDVMTKTGSRGEPVSEGVRATRRGQKSNVKPVVTALSVAPPIVSLAASRLQT